VPGLRQILCELAADIRQPNAIATFNVYPSPRGSQLNRIGSGAIQAWDDTPLTGQAVCRVVKHTHQLNGQGLGLACH